MIKRGDIFRRKTHTDKLFGAYYMYEYRRKEWLLGRYLGEENKPPFRIVTSKERIFVFSKHSIHLSDKEFDALKYKRFGVIYHDVTPMYEKVFEKKPDVIEFWKTGTGRLFFLYPIFSKVVHKGVPKIKICLENYLAYERL